MHVFAKIRMENSSINAWFLDTLDGLPFAVQMKQGRLVQMNSLNVDMMTIPTPSIGSAMLVHEHC